MYAVHTYVFLTESRYQNEKECVSTKKSMSALLLDGMLQYSSACTLYECINEVLPAVRVTFATIYIGRLRYLGSSLP